MLIVDCGKRKKAPHVCSCGAFLRRNSCRAASLSQFLRGGRGGFWAPPFLGICYAFALCSAVQEEIVALATLFE